jgi:hypothetical protein
MAPDNHDSITGELVAEIASAADGKAPRLGQLK